MKKNEELGWWLIKSKNKTQLKFAVKRGVSLPEPIGTNIKHVYTKKGVSNVLIVAKEIIKNILSNNNLEILDVFDYGTSKIEFMIKKNNEIISISLVNDLSYDFTIFTKDGDEIIYNNTQRLVELGDLRKIIQQDLER